MKSGGFSLSLKKCELGKPEVKLVGHIVGCGHRRPNPEKIAAVQNLKEPETKKQVRQIVGLFSFFREYLPGFAGTIKPLTDLTSKRYGERIPFGSTEREALQQLKNMLCEAVNESLAIIDWSKPFSLFTDASDMAVGAALTQPNNEGHEYPIAFASNKLNTTQQKWATIEKEAYAALWALNKFKHWVLGAQIILYSDHNPLTYLTESSPKSSKLMRWSLALQEFNVEFRYIRGSLNLASDCLSRMVNHSSS